MIEKVAELLALELITGEKIMSMAGDGSFIPIYLHKVGILIGEDEFGMKTGFSSKKATNIYFECLMDKPHEHQKLLFSQEFEEIGQKV